MTENYLGEIRTFGFNYAPKGWHLCDGTILNIVDNTALFSLISNAFGGDGLKTFALPDLRGRCILHPDPRVQDKTGDKGGTETVVLTALQVPMHSHGMHVEAAKGNTIIPTNILAEPDVKAESSEIITIYESESQGSVYLNPGTIGNTGEGAGHSNMQPFLVTNYCIAMTGLYPSRPSI